MNNNKLIITSLLVIIAILIIYICQTCKKETFQNNDLTPEQYSSQQLIDWFDKLESAEQRCKKIEQDVEYNAEIETNKEAESKFHELEEMDKKIEELKELLKYLTIEKNRRDNVNEKCQADTQVQLNQNYDLLNKLNEDGLVKDTQVNLDLNVSDSIAEMLKKDGYSKDPDITVPAQTKKCDNKNKNRAGYVNIDSSEFKKTHGDGKCVGCDLNKLKANKAHLNADFN
jgi:hypothetical protein